MALLNEHYIFVIDENVKRGVSISEHPVESGLDVTDNVKRNAKVISVNGEIVGKNAKKTLEKIEALHSNGKLVKYIGDNILSNAIITDLDTSHTNAIHGGCAFTMEVKEVRIAKSPLVVKKTSSKTSSKASSQKTKSGTKQVTKKSTATTKKYTVKRGDTLWAIAKKYYGNGAKYTKIVSANKSKIKNPNLIQVGWVLTIPA